MGLQVWLPLNGNLNNQGLSNVTVTNNGATVDNSGKTGSCYSFNGTTNYLTLPTSIVSNFTGDISVSCWVNITAWGSQYDSIFKMYANNTSWANCIFGMGRNGTSSKLYFSIGNTSSSTQANCVLPSDQSTGTWYHLCAVVDTTAQLMSLYLDGELKKTYSTTIVPKFSSVTSISIGGTPLSNYGLNGLINDVRIYNHALSAQEVKEISKGLILHYPLDRNNWGQDNLIKGTYKLDGDTTVASAVIKTNNAFRGFTSATYDNTSGTSYHELISWNSKVTVSANEIYTTSFYAKSPVSTTLTCYFYNNTSGVVQVASSDASTGAHNTGTDGNITIQLTPDWTYYWITWTFNSTATSATKSLLFRCLAGKGELSVCGVKLEKGNKSSPWVPNSADTLYDTLDIGNTIEYDTSGYQRNGTRSNTLTWDADSPKYDTSTIFNGSNTYIAAGTGAKVKDAITVNCWGYMDSWSSYSGRLLSCTEGGGWNFEPSSGKMNFAMGTGATGNTYKSITSVTTLAQLGSGWHMFTGTYDGFNTKIYIDGVLENTNAAYTTKTPIYYHASNGIFVGAEAASSAVTPTGSYFNGKMSDVRIYATALSADDIIELYNNKRI